MLIRLEIIFIAVQRPRETDIRRAGVAAICGETDSFAIRRDGRGIITDPDVRAAKPHKRCKAVVVGQSALRECCFEIRARRGGMLGF